MADSGYTLSPHVITPFKRCQGCRLGNNENTFNEELSKWRVVIEQSIGMLKERFQSLKEIRILLRGVSSARRVNAWIRTCIILHNFSKANGEEWHAEFRASQTPLLNPNQPEDPPGNQYGFRQDSTRRDALFAKFIASQSP